MWSLTKKLTGFVINMLLFLKNIFAFLFRLNQWRKSSITTFVSVMGSVNKYCSFIGYFSSLPPPPFSWLVSVLFKSVENILFKNLLSLSHVLPFVVKRIVMPYQDFLWRLLVFFYVPQALKENVVLLSVEIVYTCSDKVE